jgi:type I restriction enzyme S subunit
MKKIKSLTEAEIAKLPKLPEGWIWVRLDTIGELLCGQSPSIAEVNQERRGIPYVTGPEQWDGSRIKETKWTEFPKRLVPEGCIFITVKGAGVGKIFPGISCAIGRDIYAFLPSSKVDFKYIIHALMHQIDLVIMKAQGDIPGLSKNHILDHYIGLCSINEQRAIVSKIEQLFSELDNGILNLKLAQEQLKVYRQAVLKKAFEGELTKKWREQQTDLPDAGELLEQIKKEREEAARASGEKLKAVKSFAETELLELSKLPKEWAWVRVEETSSHIVDCLHSTAKFVDSGFYCIDTTCIENGKILFENARFVNEETYKDRIRRLKPESGDILFSREGTVGTTVITPENVNLCLGQRMMMFRPLKKITPKFFMYYFQSMLFSKQYKPLIGGTTSPHLNIRDIILLKFPICSLSEQQAIVQEIETRLSVCDKIEQDIETNLEKAEALRQSILKKAFEGKLLNERELAEVRGAEDWEPAEVLLKRIRKERAEDGKK